MKYNITITLIKIFLDYLNINLFNRRINSFNIVIVEDKLKAISKIIYLATLDNLEYYLDLIGYL